MSEDCNGTTRDTGSRLTTAQRFLILTGIAEFQNNQEILRGFTDQFGFEIPTKTVTYYRHTSKWEEVWRGIRKAFLDAVDDELIAHKRNRLVMLQKAYDRAMEWHVSSVNQYGSVEKCNPGAAIMAIEAARKEMEGERVKLIGADGEEAQTGVLYVSGERQTEKEWQEDADRVHRETGA